MNNLNIIHSAHYSDRQLEQTLQKIIPTTIKIILLSYKAGDALELNFNPEKFQTMICYKCCLLMNNLLTEQYLVLNY